jgi:hypothetical protein
MDIFRTMPNNFWWKLLPEEDEDLDLLVATHCPWEDWLPLLLEAKLIWLARNKNALSKYEINHNAWDELKQRFRMIGIRFEYTFYTKRLPSGYQ